jgi:hypothetical protein
MEKEFYPDDLSLRTHYSFSGCRTQVVHMKTLSFERLAKENKGKISLVHYFPSIVVTPAYDSPDMPLWFRIVWKAFGPAVKLFLSVNHEESGDRVMYLATDQFAAISSQKTTPKEDVAISTDEIKGGGAYAVNWNDEVFPQSHFDKKYKSIRSDGVGEKVWKHTMEAFESISAGEPFRR